MSDTNLPEGEGGDAPQVNETEAKARRLGWVSKEEFKGDPERHRSADEFLKRGEEILPILKRDNDKLHSVVSRIEGELKETRDTLKQFSEYASKGEERAYKRAKAELEAKLDNAIATADVDTARAARREIAELETDAPKPAPKVEKTETPPLDPVVQSWIGENEWFDKSVALRSVAIEEFGDLERQYPGKSKADLLAETKQKVMERFPEKFGINTKRDNAGAVTTPNGNVAPRKKAGKTYEDLPADAKKACDKFVKSIPGYTRDKYVKDYEWEA
ncbi:MAG: hypothetical protein JWP25_4694 [Bradyrhizobium sp.]|nr:hypothetical protein [Bradyrhizobium sp.]